MLGSLLAVHMYVCMYLCISALASAQGPTHLLGKVAESACSSAAIT